MNHKPHPAFPKKFEATYVYSDTLVRLCSILRETDHIEKITKNTLLPYLFTDKPNPWELKYTLSEIFSWEYSKKIKWIITNLQIPTPIIYTFNATQNTMQNSTVLVFEISFINADLLQKRKKKLVTGFKKVLIEVINNIETILQTYKENIYDYQSIVIKSDISRIFDCISKQKLLKEAKITDWKIEGKCDEVGTTIGWTFEKDKVKCKIQVKKVVKGENIKKWKYYLVSLLGPIHTQEINFVLIKIDDLSTFVSVRHKFVEKIDTEIMEEVTKKQKYVLNRLKEVMEEESPEKVRERPGFHSDSSGVKKE